MPAGIVQIGKQRFELKMVHVLNALIRDLRQSPLSRASTLKISWDPYPMNDPEKESHLTQDYLWPVSIAYVNTEWVYTLMIHARLWASSSSQATSSSEKQAHQHSDSALRNSPAAPACTIKPSSARLAMRLALQWERSKPFKRMVITSDVSLSPAKAAFTLPCKLSRTC